MLISGGTDALQTSVIVCGLPLCVIMVFMMASYFKSMKRLDEYDIYSKGDLSVYDTSEKERLERVAAAEAEASGSSVEKNE